MKTDVTNHFDISFFLLLVALYFATYCRICCLKLYFILNNVQICYKVVKSINPNLLGFG